MKIIPSGSGAGKLISIMVKNKLVVSNGEGRRMITQGAVKLDGEKVDDIHFSISDNSAAILKVGSWIKELRFSWYGSFRDSSCLNAHLTPSSNAQRA